MAIVIDIPADVRSGYGGNDRPANVANDPLSGQEIDNRPPQGPQARSWTTGSAAGNNWIAAVIILAIAALAIWYVLKKMK